MSIDTSHQHEPVKIKLPATPRNKWVVISMILLALVTLGVGIYLYATKPTAQDSETARGKQYITNNNKVVCVSLNGPLLQCENLETGERKQYSIPESLGEVTNLVPSPDQTKYLASGYTYSERFSEQSQVVLDSNFAVVNTLPKDNDYLSTQYLWHGNDALVKITDTYEEEASSRSISIVSLDGKTIGTINTPDQYAQIVGSDGDNVYMQYAKGDEEAMNSGQLVLVSTGVNRPAQEINISDFSMNPDGALEVTTDVAISYDPGMQAFYTNILGSDTANPSYTFKVGKLNNQQLNEVYRINNHAMDYPAPVFTTRGFWVNNFSVAGQDPPQRYELAGPDAVVTQLKLPVTSQNFLFSLVNFPSQNGTAVNPDTQAAAFVFAPEGTPSKITDFMEQRVTFDCIDNNFRRVSLVARDGTDQLVLSESGCDSGASYYYIYADNTYNQVYASQQGIGCETRDKLGLSPKLLPECRKPGEPL